jgi:hypothetical protein
MGQRGRKPGFSPGSKIPDSERGPDGSIDYDYHAKKIKAKKAELRRETVRTKEKKLYAFMHGKKIEYIVCPVCQHAIPRKVKVNRMGEPYKASTIGNVYVDVNGVLQRRFSGPVENPNFPYFPLQIRYAAGRDKQGRSIGTFVKPDESVIPRVLETKDHQLFQDFKKIIRKAAQAFEASSY